MKKTTVTLLILAGIAFVSCSRQETATKQEPEAAAPAAASKVSPELAALLPAKNEVPGWAASQAPRAFTAGNLWEFINGAADGYLAYGFEEVVTADFAQEGTGYQAVVDIYRMKDPLNAFGIYTQERNPDYPFLKVGNEGYSGGTAVNFWTGSYYVKITTFEEKEAIQQEMLKMAQAVAGKVKDPGAEPAEVGFFPKANQLPHTIVYIPKDVLAQSFFTNGFEAKYKQGDKEYKMILIRLESPDAAKEALARYRQFLSAGGKTVKGLAVPGEGGFTGQDSFYGNVAAAASGNNIAVALGTPSEDAGKKLITELLENTK